MRRCMPSSKARGMTLLEVTVAAAVMVILVLGVLSTMISSARLSTATSEQEVALAIVRSKLEEIRGTNFDSIAVQFTAQSTTLTALPGAMTVALLTEVEATSLMATAVDYDGDGAATATTLASADSVYAYGVEVIVTWTSFGVQQRAAGNTLVMKRASD